MSPNAVQQKRTQRKAHNGNSSTGATNPTVARMLLFKHQITRAVDRNIQLGMTYEMAGELAACEIFSEGGSEKGGNVWRGALGQMSVKGFCSLAGFRQKMRNWHRKSQYHLICPVSLLETRKHLNKRKTPAAPRPDRVPGLPEVETRTLAWVRSNLEV